jgi:transcriptional regulator with XRE-family HTH domain
MLACGVADDRDDLTLTFGEIIRRQRELSQLSMRQFATMVGISNPYLSQIERGLRAPSEEVTEAIARALRTSADALYEQAGFQDDADAGPAPVIEAIRADPALSARQRQALLTIYQAFTGAAPSARRRRPRRPRGGEAI